MRSCRPLSPSPARPRSRSTTPEVSAVGSDLLRMGRRLQDCRLQSDLVLLVGSKRDSGELPTPGGGRWQRALLIVIAPLRERGASSSGDQDDRGRQHANSNGGRPHSSAASIEQENTWTIRVLLP